jgi:hypothetical protein
MTKRDCSSDITSCEVLPCSLSALLLARKYLPSRNVLEGLQCQTQYTIIPEPMVLKGNVVAATPSALESLSR